MDMGGVLASQRVAGRPAAPSSGDLPVAAPSAVATRHATCLQNNDACFDKLKPLYEGEKYVDSSRCEHLVERACAVCAILRCSNHVEDAARAALWVQGWRIRPPTQVEAMHHWSTAERLSGPRSASSLKRKTGDTAQRVKRVWITDGVCRQALLAKLASKQKRVSEAFKPCSPMKRSCGKGDHYGTLQGNVPYIAVRSQFWARLFSRRP